MLRAQGLSARGYARDVKNKKIQEPPPNPIAYVFRRHGIQRKHIPCS